MISKKLTIRETNTEQDYYFDFLFEGESEDKIDSSILEYLMKWYDIEYEYIENIDLENKKIDFGFARIKWWINPCSRKEFIQSFIEERIKKIE